MEVPSMHAVILVAAVAAVAACAAMAAEPEPPGPTADGRYAKWDDDDVLIEVHRSMRLLAPENSLRAAQLCYQAGGDAIDCDVRSTLDDVVVCFHDRDPSARGTASIYPVGRLTWAEAKDVLIEPLSYPKANQTIPRFEDCLRFAAANNMAVYIDPKEAVAASRAKSMLQRYDASHLLRWPRWPRLYYWTSRQAHDIAGLQRLLGAGEFRDLVGKKDVTLAAGDPRSLRVDDPRILAALTGRDLSVRDLVWEPWPEALFACPIEAPKTMDSFTGALGGEGARLAASELCRRFPAKAGGWARGRLGADDTPAAVRVECLWMLGQLGDAGDADLLRDGLNSADARAREAAAYSLGRLKAAAASADLRKGARDADPMAAAAAAWALWRIGDASAAGDVVAALAERLAKPREGDQQAIRMLLLAAGTWKAAAAVPVIEKHMLDASQAANANVAIAALGAIGGEKAVALARRLYDTHGRAVEPNNFCRAMAVAGPAGTPQLLERLAAGDRKDCMDATLTLAEVPDAVTAIRGLLATGKPTPAAKAAMVSVLVLHADPAAKGVLATLAGDGDETVARLAKWATSRR